MIRHLRTRLAILLRSILQRNRLEAEIDDELSFHLEARAADLVRRGLAPREAARQARLEFGATASAKDGMRSAFGLRWLDDTLADLRYAIRLLRKSPGFTTIAVTSLALAIGANTTIFSVANEMLYARLAVPRPRELRILYAIGPRPLAVHMTWGSNWEDGGQSHIDSFAYPFYRELQKSSPTEIFAFKDYGNLNVTANGVAQAASAQFVSGNFYSQMEVKPQLGRPILPSDDSVAGQSSVVVLSDGFWHRAFGAARDVLGKSINVDGHLLTVVGVNPPGFTGAQSVQISPELFLPFAMTPQLASGFRDDLITSTNFWWVSLMTRIRPGVSADTTATALSTQLDAVFLAAGKPKPDEHIPAVALEDGSRGSAYRSTTEELGRPLHVLLALSGLVLLLACANIANLMLARVSVRRREMSVRLALGASRARILRQVLTESILLSTMGGSLGLLLGYLCRNTLPRLMQSSFSEPDLNIPFHWTIFAFASAVTLLTGLLFGILPAWLGTREEVSASLKETARSTTRRRSAWSSKSIVALQIALSTLLVTSSALFLRTLTNLNRIDPGFHADHLLNFELSPPVARYPGTSSVAIYQRLEQAIASAPGVSGVTVVSPPFLADNMWNNDFDIEGQPPIVYNPDDPGQYPSLMNVGERFFAVTGIPILRGRAFGPQDTATSPAVSVINEATARKFFPHSDPIGRRFKDDEDKDHVKHFRTIVGVCANTLYNSVRTPPGPIHFDLYATQKDFRGATFLVRSQRPVSALVPDLRDIIRRIDPDLPMTNIRTQRQQIDANLHQERLFAILTSSFGLLALLLACVGIYGIMAYTVTQRTNEIGIRLALGARRAQVRSMVLREALTLSILGIAAGLTLVLVLVHLVSTILYGLRPRDPASLTASALLLLAIALLAAWIPAQRASHVEPMKALRHD